jgi:hypothetical protein
MPDGPTASLADSPSTRRNQPMASARSPRTATVAVFDGLTSADESCPEAPDLDLPVPASAVGPFSTAPPEQAPAAGANPSAPPPVQSLKIALLLSSGVRNTFTITKGYLRKRDALPESGDPYDISVYTLKSLIFREWHPGASLHVLRWLPAYHWQIGRNGRRARTLYGSSSSGASWMINRS